MLYGNQVIDSIEKLGNSDTLLEYFLVDDVLRLKSDQIHEFCESEEAKILTEKAVLKKPTLIRLSKEDDFRRRVKIAAYELAKEANDPQWTKLKKYKALYKQCSANIMKKYGSKGEKVAKIAQKNYIKTASKISGSAAAEKK